MTRSYCGALSLWPVDIVTCSHFWPVVIVTQNHFWPVVIVTCSHFVPETCLRRRHHLNSKRPKVNYEKLICLSFRVSPPHIGCFDSGTYYREGEKLPSNPKRPCEMCYCIKGFRKCVVKKCAPLIRGCIPKILKEGSCCPTNYDCSRSLKLTRQVRQNNDDEPEDDIDFFSLLFGSEEPQEEEVKTEKPSSVIEVTTLQPFKALPSTEKSFFDFIRAGLEIIDANADKFALDDRAAVTLAPTEVVHEELLEITTVTSRTNSVETSTAKVAETTQKLSSSLKPSSTTKIKLPEKIVTLSSESTSSSPKLAATSAKPSSTTPATTPPRTGTSELSKLSFLSFVREILS